MADPRAELLDQVLSAARAVYPETEPLIEDDLGDAVTVATGAPRRPWDAEAGVAAAARWLGENGWEVTGPEVDGDRWHAGARRGDATIVVRMAGRDGILRLSGRHTP